MRRARVKQAALALLLLAATGCGRTGPLPGIPQPCVFDTDCEEGLRCINQLCSTGDEADGGRRGDKVFGEPCEDGAECQSGSGLGGPRGAFGW